MDIIKSITVDLVEIPVVINCEIGGLKRNDGYKCSGCNFVASLKQAVKNHQKNNVDCGSRVIFKCQFYKIQYNDNRVIRLEQNLGNSSSFDMNMENWHQINRPKDPFFASQQCYFD